MRLTVFHNSEIEPLWQSSLEKLINPLAFEMLKEAGDVHLAVFNDGVVGISITKDNEITFLKVRDITRRRGVGKYLLEETCNFIADLGFEKTYIDTKRFPNEELDGLIYFLEMQGFEKSAHDSSIYEYNQ